MCDLASADRQRRYQASLPSVSATAELRCGWFDDLYHPDTDLFLNSFSPAEREALAQFHQAFAAALPDLPPDESGLEAYIESTAGRRVEAAAQAVLLKCGWVAHDR